MLYIAFAVYVWFPDYITTRAHIIWLYTNKARAVLTSQAQVATTVKTE